MPTVSVIIATRNRRGYLEECLRSVLNQTYTDYEVIVVDDGSTDDTPSFLKSMSDRIISKSIEHSGPSIPRNVALDIARGKLIAFHDDDDLWTPDHLELHIKFLDQHPEIDAVFSDLVLFDENGVIFDSWMAEKTVFQSIPRHEVSDKFYLFDSDIFEPLIRERFMTMPTLMVRRHCLDQIGHFDPRLKAQVDYDLFLRLAHSCTVGYIDRPLAKCRVHATNLSGNPERRIRSKTVLWEKMAFLYPDLPARQRKLIRQQTGYWYFELGYHYFSQNNFSSARENFRRAIRFWPVYGKSLMYFMLSYLPISIIDRIRRARGRNRKPEIS